MQNLGTSQPSVQGLVDGMHPYESLDPFTSSISLRVRNNRRQDTINSVDEIGAVPREGLSLVVNCEYHTTPAAPAKVWIGFWQDKVVRLRRVPGPMLQWTAETIIHPKLMPPPPSRSLQLGEMLSIPPSPSSHLPLKIQGIQHRHLSPNPLRITALNRNKSYNKMGMQDQGIDFHRNLCSRALRVCGRSHSPRTAATPHNPYRYQRWHNFLVRS